MSVNREQNLNQSKIQQVDSSVIVKSEATWENKIIKRLGRFARNDVGEFRVSCRLILSFVIVTLFSGLQFYLMLMTGLIASQLKAQFLLSSFSLGVLTSAYLLPYLFTQFFASVFFAMFCIRRILILSAFICGVGTIVFSLSSHSFMLAIIGRLLMGLGGSFGFIGLVKFVNVNFSQSYFNLLVGVSEFFSILFVSISEHYTESFLQHNTWAQLMLLVGIYSLLLSLFLWISVKKSKKKMQNTNQNILLVQLNSIRSVLKNTRIWYASIYGAALFAVFSVLSSLWGGVLLKQVYLFSSTQIATIFSIMLFFAAVGFLVFSVIAKNQNHGKTIMLGVSSLTLICMIFLMFPIWHYSEIIILFSILGFASSGYFLSYQQVISSVKTIDENAAIAFCSFMVIFAAVFLQPFMGFIVELSRGNVQNAIVFIIILLGIAAFGSYKLKKYGNSTISTC